jgi:hypothetical protein
MAWIQVESFRVRSLAFADELVWREAFEGLEAAGEIVRVDEVAKMGAQLGACLRRGLVPFDLREPADAVSLQAAMRGRPRQMGYGRLQGVETIVGRQEGMAQERDGDRLLFD